MKLSTRARYGVRLKLVLAVNYGKGPVFLKDIARGEEISEKYLSLIMIPLRTAGLVNSTRGAYGGYSLARDPALEMAASRSVAADALSTVLPWGASAIAVVIAISALGTALIYTLSAPRIYFAMAEDGLFFAPLARVHPRFHTPVFAVVFQSLWAIALILMWGTFEQVITYVTFTDWIFFTAAACLVFVFRRRRPDAKRPYRTAGYPLTPLVFIAVSALFILNTLIERPAQAGWSLALLASGLPFYAWFKR